MKYLIVAIITIGVSCFMLLADDKKHGKSKSSASRTIWESLWGLFLLTINLSMDGIINSTQDRIFHAHKRLTGTQMMFYMNLFSSLLMSVYLIVSNPFNGEFSGAIQFCIDHTEAIRDIILFGLCGAIGQCFIFHTIESFGSVLLVTVTVTRKMFSIVLSVLWFGHKLAFAQWMSVLVVFTGIVMESLFKTKSKKNGDKKKNDKTEVDDVLDDNKNVTPKVTKAVETKKLK